MSASIFKVNEIVSTIVEYLCPPQRGVNTISTPYRGIANLMRANRVCFTEAAFVLYNRQDLEVHEALRVFDAARSYDNKHGTASFSRVELYRSTIQRLTVRGESEPSLGRLVSYRPRLKCLFMRWQLHPVDEILPLLTPSVECVYFWPFQYDSKAEFVSYTEIFDHMARECPNLKDLAVMLIQFESTETKMLQHLLTKSTGLSSLHLWGYPKTHDRRADLDRCLSSISSRNIDNVVVYAHGLEINPPVAWDKIELHGLKEEGFKMFAPSAGASASKLDLYVSMVLSPLLTFCTANPALRELRIKGVDDDDEDGITFAKGIDQLGKVFPNLTILELVLLRATDHAEPHNLQEAVVIKDNEIERLVESLPGLVELILGLSWYALTHRSLVAVGRTCRGIRHLELCPEFSHYQGYEYREWQEHHRLLYSEEDVRELIQLEFDEPLFPELVTLDFFQILMEGYEDTTEFSESQFFDKNFPKID